MGKIVKEGVCLPVYGYEEDYLDFIDETRTAIGVSSLVREAGGLPTEWTQGWAFEREGTEWDDAMGIEAREEFRKLHNRTLPPLYRIKITVELEEMPAEFIESYWENQRNRTAAIPNRIPEP